MPSVAARPRIIEPSHQAIIDRIEIMDQRIHERIDGVDARLQETREGMVRIETMQVARSEQLKELVERVDKITAPAPEAAAPWWRPMVPLAVAVMAGAGLIAMLDRAPQLAAIIGAWRQ